MPDIIPAGSNGYELSLLYNQWIALGDTRTQIYSGTFAQRPAANAVFTGAMYRPTDLFGGRAFFVSDGTNWKLQNGTLLLSSSSTPITKTGAGNVTMATVVLPAGIITSSSQIIVRYRAGITNNGGTSNRFIRVNVGAGSNVPSLQISGTTIPAVIDTKCVIQCSSLSAQDSSRMTLFDTGVIQQGSAAGTADLSIQTDVSISFELVALAAQDVMTLYSYEITLTNY